MIYNYFSIILRNLWRSKLYTLINVFGMAVGLAAIVWAWQTYRFCFSFNDFHPDRDRIFWAILSKDGSDQMKGISPMPMALAAKQDFASIEKAVRWNSWSTNIKAEKGETFLQEVHFTDPDFFDLFHFPLVAGSKDLTDRSAVLITEEMAQKYFGTENPLGKTLLLYAGEPQQVPLTVKGILKKPPINSSIRFDMLTNFNNQTKADGTALRTDDWAVFTGAAFFKLANPSDASRLAQDFNKYLPLQNAARPQWKVTGFKLVPFSEVASVAQHVGINYLYERPDDSAAYGPFVLAVLIFLSACLNFANTTVARSNRRLKEMGVRKVMGGTQAQLIRQLLLECGVVVLLAAVLSIQLNQWWIPFFNSMFNGISVVADYTNDLSLLLFIGALLLGATLLAGAYPAFYVSRFNPTSILSGTVKFGGTNTFSRILLGFQVAVSLITVTAAVAFSQNAEFQRTYDYGYDRENLVLLSVPDESAYRVMQEAARALPGTAASAGTQSHIGFSYSRLTVEANAVKKETAYLAVGDGYGDLMKLELAAGRALDPSMPSDYDNKLLVSQKFAAMYGWKDSEALEQQVYIDTIQFTVAGVLKDFHNDNLFDPTEPVVMRLVRPEKYQYVVIRAKPGALISTFDQMKAAWANAFPLKPFNGFYHDEIAAEALRVTTSISQIFAWFAIVSILLAATGLFALVSLTVLKKMKEIAVRRVVGASSMHVLVLVNKGYFWIFLIAAIIGGYGGYALTKLLMDMIFEINVGVGAFSIVFSVFSVLIIALATVGVKVWQAIRTNPAEVLNGD
ncbi:MAG: ABC transporter permease [Saprospiraceae bacterium]